MTDLSKTIAPKSDQLNADDLIGRNLTIEITDVRGVEGDQPIAVSFRGDNGKPYKPCKSMRRVMVHCWGADGKQYVGRRMSIFRDDEVVFGGIKVGGIRISHLSHIDGPKTMALTNTRASRKPYTVKPLRADVKGFDGPRQEAGADDFPGDRASGFGGGRSDADEGFTGWAAEQAVIIDSKQTVADLDAYSNDPEVGEQFVSLKADTPSEAIRLEAKLRGRRKMLLDRERARGRD